MAYSIQALVAPELLAAVQRQARLPCVPSISRQSCFSILGTLVLSVNSIYIYIYPIANLELARVIAKPRPQNGPRIKPKVTLNTPNGK
eukprot:2457625-Amphidinium_carterae.4